METCPDLSRYGDVRDFNPIMLGQNSSPAILILSPLRSWFSLVKYFESVSVSFRWVWSVQTDWLVENPNTTSPSSLCRKYDNAMVVLKNLQDGMLGDMCDDGGEECTKVRINKNSKGGLLCPHFPDIYPWKREKKVSNSLSFSLGIFRKSKCYFTVIFGALTGTGTIIPTPN